MRFMRTTSFLATLLALTGCKLGLSDSAVKEGEQAATTSGQSESSRQTMEYHGMTVSTSLDGAMVATGDSMPDYLGTDLNSATATAIASNSDTSSSTEVINGPDQAAFSLAGGAKTTYMTGCEGQGVPLPPAWGDPAWVKAGEMTTIVVLMGRKTELWTFRPADGSGICAALPRFDTGTGNISFMGVICSNLKSGKTCFYDNVVGGAKVAVKAGYEVSDGEGGDKLGENCSDCHRGDDQWVVVPKQPTAKLPKPSALYAPIGQANWKNATPGPPAIQCAEGCHAIPELTEFYCGIANEMIKQYIMPQGVAKGTVGDGVKEFQDACKTAK